MMTYESEPGIYHLLFIFFVVRGDSKNKGLAHLPSKLLLNVICNCI